MNWLFGDNINTDLIIPGRYNLTTDAKELAKVAFIEYRPEFAQKVKRGDFIVAGTNFGCGSSRETAVTALKACEIKAILAKSFARIFYRNCLNQGLLAVVADTSQIAASDVLVLNLDEKTLLNKTKNKKIKIEVPALMVKLYQEGGILPFLKKQGLEAISQFSS